MHKQAITLAPKVWSKYTVLTSGEDIGRGIAHLLEGNRLYEALLSAYIHHLSTKSNEKDF